MNETGNFVMFWPKANCTLEVRLSSKPHCFNCMAMIKRVLNTNPGLALPDRSECIWLPAFSPRQHFLCGPLHYRHLRACLSWLAMEDTLVYVVYDFELHP